MFKRLFGKKQNDIVPMKNPRKWFIPEEYIGEYSKRRQEVKEKAGDYYQLYLFWKWIHEIVPDLPDTAALTSGGDILHPIVEEVF